MPMTDAILTADLASVFTDLASTSITETVSRIPRGEDDVDGTFDIIRAKQKSAKDLESTGYTKEYRFTVYAQRSAASEVGEGDVLVMSDGSRLRVFSVNPGPATIWISFDLGGEYEADQPFRA